VFGYSKRCKWHGAVLAIDQSRACISAIHATSPDPISGHRFVFKLLKLMRKVSEQVSRNMQRVEVVLQQMSLHISIEIYMHPRIPGRSRRIIYTHSCYAKEHATFLHKKQKKIIYEKRKSFKTGEPANSGLSRTQLLIVSSINTSDIVR
jgi:hypothetical protein